MSPTQKKKYSKINNKNGPVTRRKMPSAVTMASPQYEPGKRILFCRIRIFIASRGRKNQNLLARKTFGDGPMLGRLGLSLLLLASHTDAFAQPLRFVCEPPHGKRVEQSGGSKTANDTEWIDESLESVHPAVTVDGETLTVTWGSTIPNQSKGGAPKPTTYVFASAYRDERSILATRVDRTGAEIFRFYFGSKVLFRITSNPGSAPQEVASAAAIHIASCRDQ
jgi:hypothetical protein